MPVLYVLQNFIIVLCMIVPSSSATAGTYRVSIVSVTECKNPARPYMKDPPIVLKPVVHNATNTSLLSGKIEMRRDVSRIKLQTKSYFFKDNKWKLNFILNDIDCHGLPIHFMCKAFNIKYDRKTCTYFKGQFVFNDIDINIIQHMWQPIMEYGQMLWRIETFIGKNTVYCFEFVLSSQPVEKHDSKK